jgi:hypothetical protein
MKSKGESERPRNEEKGSTREMRRTGEMREPGGQEKERDPKILFPEEFFFLT